MGLAATPNVYQCAYPNFSECVGGPDCTFQPDLPFDVLGCAFGLSFSTPCNAGGICAALQDCGPNPGQGWEGGYCNPGGFQPLVACLNSNAFASLCGCNPMVFGVIYINGDTSDCS